MNAWGVIKGRLLDLWSQLVTVLAILGFGFGIELNQNTPFPSIGPILVPGKKTCYVKFALVGLY